MEQEEVRALVSQNRPKSAEGYPASVKHAVVTYALTQRAKGARAGHLAAPTAGALAAEAAGAAPMAVSLASTSRR